MYVLFCVCIYFITFIYAIFFEYCEIMIYIYKSLIKQLLIYFTIAYLYYSNYSNYSKYSYYNNYSDDIIILEK